MNPSDCLLTYYRTHFPDWTNIQIGGFTRMADGLASDVFGCTLSYVENGTAITRDLIVKSYPGSTDAARKAAHEYHTMQRLHMRGYPVPQVFTLETDPAPLGAPFMTMARFQGRVLWNVIHDSSPERRHDLIGRFARLFLDLHQLPLDSVPGDCIAAEIVSIRQLIGVLGDDQFGAVVDWLENHRADAGDPHPVLIHRDYHPWNVLLTGADRMVVIDWNAEISDARFDLAWTLALLRRAGFGDFAAEVWTAYKDLAPFSVEPLTYFEIAAQLRWMVIVLTSLTSGAALRSDVAANFARYIVPMVRAACEQIASITGIVLKPAAVYDSGHDQK